jgi:hypothetical protein
VIVSVTETFDKANSTTLGPVLSWTEVAGDWSVVNNRATALRPTSAYNSVARASTAMTGADHQATVEVVALAPTDSEAGPAVRFSSTAQTCYWLEIGGTVSAGDPDPATSGATRYYLTKSINGTITYMKEATFPTKPLPFTVRLEAEGSTLRGYVNDILVVTHTDTGISTGSQCGMFLYDAQNTSMINSWSAGDLGAKALALAGSIRPTAVHRKTMPRLMPAQTSMTGAMTRIKTATPKVLSGVASPFGVLVGRNSVAKFGAVALVGVVRRAPRSVPTGSVTPTSPVLRRAFVRRFVGSTTPRSQPAGNVVTDLGRVLGHGGQAAITFLRRTEIRMRDRRR